MKQENKTRIPVYIHPGLLRRVDGWVEEDNCSSRSEFIEKALRFYLGYLSSEDMTDYLSTALVAVIRGTLEDSLHRLGRMVFKWCVELNMGLHMLAAHFGVEDADRQALRNFAEDEVRRSNGRISFDHALDVQVDDNDSEDASEWPD